jgi:hypothetical protein
MLTTTRRAIQYPNTDRSDRADIALHISYAALAADVDVLYNQGTDAARLAAAHQTNGGRLWWTTDTNLLWYDDGTTWRSIAPPATSQAGLLSARPAATSVVSGYRFFATDQVVDFVSDGTNWIRTGVPAGTTVDWFKPDAAVPNGWTLYDGSNLPASTGIYADLYAHLGNSLTKPDTRGRVSVALGTHGDVSGMGVNDGLVVGTRTPRHNSTSALGISNTMNASHNLSLPNHAHSHSLTLPDHQHTLIGRPGAASDYTDMHPGLSTDTPQAVNQTNGHCASLPAIVGSVNNPTSLPGISGAVTLGGSVTLTGSIGPGGTRPSDGAAYIVCEKIAKL